MRVGLLTTSFPRFEGDVPGAFVLGFARALVRQGHEVEVLAPEPDRGADGPPRFAGVRVRWVPYLRPRRLERTFYGAGVLDNLRREPAAALGLLPFTLALAEATRRRLPSWDAVVSHWALPCALIAGTLRGRARHLAVLHSADVSLLERLPLRGLLAQRIAQGADQLVFSSQSLRARFGALLDPLARADAASRMHVCAMGVDALSFEGDLAPRQRLRRELGVEGYCLLSLGRLVPIKGLEHAIDAVAQLSGVELVVAGAGPLEAALRARAERRGARVRFVGVVRGPLKQAWLRAADAFVLSSVELASGRSEGMPNSVLEAMQAGLPVIASATGGIRDVVQHEHNGLLVPPGDVPALVAAVERLRGDADLAARLASQGRETAALYDWNVLGPHFSALLQGEL